MAVDQLILELVTKGFEKGKRVLQQVAQSINNIKFNVQKLKADMLALGLAFLFTGMAIKKFFGDLLKSSFNTFQSIVGDNNIMIQKTGELMAAWEFFKFSLIDALSQSDLFMSMIDTVIQLVNWFNRLSPEAKETIALLIVGFTAVGSIIMVIGMTLLFLQGIFNTTGILMLATIGSIAAAWILWNDDIDESKSKFQALGIILTGLGVIMAVVFGLNPLTLVILALGVIILTITFLIDKYGSLKNAVLVFAIAAIDAFETIGDSIEEFLLEKVISFIDLLKSAVVAFNELTGANFGVSALNAIQDTYVDQLASVKEQNKLYQSMKDKLEAMKDPVEEQASFWERIQSGISNIKTDIFSKLQIGTTEEGAVAAIETTEKKTEETQPVQVIFNQEQFDYFTNSIKEGTQQGTSAALETLSSIGISYPQTNP